jgi:hypothetical protein
VRHAWGAVVPYVVMGVVAATIVVGTALDRSGVVLGAPLPPFLGDVEPRASLLAVPVALVLAIGVTVAPRLRAGRIGPAPFALGLLALALVLRVALSTARNGPDGWYAVFDTSFEAKNEYLPALTYLSYGAPFFLDRFAELVPALPVHSAGHPPGLLLTLHGLGIDGPRGMAALVIGLGSLAAPLTYALGRVLLPEPAARAAGLLFAFAPSALHHGATSADALYATLGTLAALGLLAGPAAARALGAAALAIASFFSYALLACGAWATLVVLRREGLRPATALAASCAAAVALLAVSLWAATGYDAPGALRSTEQVYRFSVASIRPYAYWVLGSPAAYLAAMGLPLAWYALRALARRSAPALALAAVVVTSAVLGFTKAETERIWLFLVPLACVAAADALPARRLTLVLGLLALQALLVELLLVTVW